VLTDLTFSSFVRRSAVLLAIAGSLIGPPTAFAAVLHAVSWNASGLYEIDTGTGVATLIGSTGLFDLGGIAHDDVGGLYAFDGSSTNISFHSVDPGTGAATLVGLTGLQGGEGALVWDPTDNVFYSRANVGGSGGGLTMELVSIDAGTGVGTWIGNMGLNLEADISGLALLPDGTLLGLDSQSALPSRLVEIDKGTGVATVIGATGDTYLSSLGGLALDPDTGTLYMSNGIELFTVDPGTGAATLVGAHGEIITGLSFDPAPPPVPTCLLALDETSTLFDVDPMDGSTSNLRPMGVDQLGSLVRSPGGTIYSLRAGVPGELYTADLVTGTASLIGSTGIPIREGGLDFQPVSGVLYGVNSVGAGELFTLDTGTGAATVIGTILDEFGFPIDTSALAFDAIGNLYVIKSFPTPEIYRVNPVDASVFDRVSIPALTSAVGPVGMEFDDSTGVLYLSIDGELLSLDPVTGATTLIGPTPSTSGLEVVSACFPPLTTAVPTLTPWAYVALVILLATVAAGARRKGHARSS